MIETTVRVSLNPLAEELLERERRGKIYERVGYQLFMIVSVDDEHQAPALSISPALRRLT